MSATLGYRSASMLAGPRMARAAVVSALLAGAAAGLAVGQQSGPATDVELMHLLRAMAVLKVAFVAAAAGSILWRLQSPVRPLWLAAYSATSACMAAGPLLIWFSSHIILASIMLHAGFAAAALLLWRDDATANLLRAAVTRRRARLSAAGPSRNNLPCANALSRRSVP